ncbi:MAG TPA: DUF4899 domain-containing protein [Tepiditoga sp.]|nr:DUF4899 domain-containing protein [Thermotogota bacterium]HOO73851.1 DUF4899 domain-containing protein [Tepiditoga sp.]
MDFYAVKYMATSLLTGETYLGYIFGKKKQEPNFNGILINKARIQNYKLPSIQKPYLDFKSDMDMLVYKILNDVKIGGANRQFSAYLFSTFKKYGMDILSTKIFLAVQDGDPFVLKAIVQDILFDWAGETEVKLVAEKFNYEDLTWIQAATEKGEDGAYTYLSRDDVKNAVDVFPIIDPMDGYPLSKLDVGDPILVLVTTENKNDSKNALEGSVISKEIVPTTDYLFLKIDLGNGKIGKTVVLRNMKIAVDSYKLEASRKKRDRILEDEKEKVIGDIVNELTGESKIKYTSKVNSSDIIIVLAFSAVGILLIVLVGILFLT